MVDELELEHACADLSNRDADLAKAYSTIGLPKWRTNHQHYHSLASLVTYQLVSTKAAAAIFGRVMLSAGGKVEPEIIRYAKEDMLRECGLSGPKITHLKSIAEAVLSGDLNLKALQDLSDTDARKQLVKVKGIGPWTAEVYLLTALQRMDAFPEGDVGLMESLKHLQGEDERMTAKAFLAHAETWRPYRGAAAHLLWGYLHHLRGE